MKTLSMNIVCLLVITGIVPLARGTDWPTFHQNTALTGVSPDRGPNTNAFCWEPFQTGSAIKASPVIAEGTVYIGNTGGQFYAVDAFSGVQKWMVNVGAAIHGTAAVDNGVAYVLDENGVFHGFNATTGAEMPSWPVPLGNGQWDWSSPAVHAGNIFVADSTGVVHSLNETTGASNWATPGAGTADSMISVSNGKVYTGTHAFDNSAPTLMTFDENNGSSVWSYNYHQWHNGVTGMVNCNGATVADADGKAGLEVYLGVYNWNGVGPQAVCLDEATGNELWSVNLNGNSTSTPAIHDGKVFIGSDDGKLHCLDSMNNGAEIWSYQTGGAVWSSPVVADGKVYFGSWDHTVYCVDETNGSLIWQYFTGASRLMGSGALADGIYYTGNENGNLYAFGMVGVPEPATMALLGLGTVGLFGKRKT